MAVQICTYNFISEEGKGADGVRIILLEKMWTSMGKGKKVLHLNCHTYFNYLILFYCENISLLPFLKFLFLLFYDEKDRNKSCKFHKFLLLILCNA